MEYRILMRINCHKDQFNNLYKSSSTDFRRRNKYNEILPYKHNMVRLLPQPGQEGQEDFDEHTGGGKSPTHSAISSTGDKYQLYYNASFINVGTISIIYPVKYRQAWPDRKAQRY